MAADDMSNQPKSWLDITMAKHFPKVKQKEQRWLRIAKSLLATKTDPNSVWNEPPESIVQFAPLIFTFHFDWDSIRNRYPKECYAIPFTFSHNVVRNLGYFQCSAQKKVWDDYFAVWLSVPPEQGVVSVAIESSKRDKFIFTKVAEALLEICEWQSIGEPLSDATPWVPIAIFNHGRVVMPTIADKDLSTRLQHCPVVAPNETEGWPELKLMSCDDEWPSSRFEFEGLKYPVVYDIRRITL